MPDPAAAPEVHVHPWRRRPSSALLVDRYVRVVDELQGVIEQQPGAWQLGPLIERVLHDDLPECTTPEDAEERRQEAIQELLARYRAEVEIPAMASLRKLNASRRSIPGALRREPVAFFSGAEGDAAYYADVLDGIDLHLPDDQLAGAPAVTSLSLGISWPPGHRLRTRPLAGFISSCDESLLALYVGPCHPQPGFYLLYNSSANSVAIAPPLSSSRVNLWSHTNIGGGVAVLNLQAKDGGCYVLAELFLRKDNGRTSHNKATLFMWWSPGSGRWVQKEVELPLPAADQHSFPFRADMVFAAAGTALCWVDLLTGVLVCNHIDRLALTTNIEDDPAACGCPVFHFIPLPPTCGTKQADTLRGNPEQYRSMCPMDDNGDTFKFVSMVGYSEDDGPNNNEVVLTTWTLKNALTLGNWEWEEDAASFCIRDLWDDPIYKDDLKLKPLMPSFPVICPRLDGTVIYLSVTDYEYMHGHEGLKLQPTGYYYQLSLDMLTGRLSSAIKLPPDENGIVRHPWIFSTSHFGSYFDQ